MGVAPVSTYIGYFVAPYDNASDPWWPCERTCNTWSHSKISFLRPLIDWLEIDILGLLRPHSGSKWGLRRQFQTAFDPPLLIFRKSDGEQPSLKPCIKVQNLVKNRVKATLSIVNSSGKDPATKSNEFLEKCQRGGEGSFSIQKYILQIL